MVKIGIKSDYRSLPVFHVAKALDDIRAFGWWK